jgi:hypothetical protein
VDDSWWWDLKSLVLELGRHRGEEALGQPFCEGKSSGEAAARLRFSWRGGKAGKGAVASSG